MERERARKREREREREKGGVGERKWKSNEGGGSESMTARKLRAAANTWDRQHQDKAEPRA